jgi:hypothetical protein
MWLRRVCLVSVVALAGVGVAAAPSAAAIECSGHFCAYDLPGLEGPLLKSNAPLDAKVEVADDRVESGENNTLHRWEGRNRRWGPIPDSTVFVWFSGDIAFDLGDANNKIDHFDVR